MAVWPIPQELQDNWQNLREMIMGSTQPSIMKEGESPMITQQILHEFSKLIYPEEPKDAFVGGVTGLAPGFISTNYRSVQQIQQLRKTMAEEMRSRGNVPFNRVSPFSADVPLETNTLYGPNSALQIDPIDQILRGSWYHGMSGKAREKIYDLSDLAHSIGRKQENMHGYWDIPESPTITAALETGFPISLHDTASISNKLGEPAGISISMLPTKAVQFNDVGDQIIHRVLPQYGGSPIERTVNLMTPEGRKALNDAYDVVANKIIGKNVPNIAHVIDRIPPSDLPNKNVLGDLAFYLLDEEGVGSFNQQLSNQLQSSGYRGLLYNPQRWNEYEMLMLDPKYVLPLDYRKVEEYTAPVNRERYYGLSNPGTTPGTSKGLSQIVDIMAQNKSRLGDIYSERPWTQRLSTENKNRLLELIDPQYRETVGNQLFQ